MSKKQTIYLKDYKESKFNILSVDLNFDLYDDFVIVTNVMKISKVDKNAEFISLDSVDLELLEILLDKKILKEYSYENDKLTIQNIPEIFILSIKNKIYPHKNTELEGLYSSNSIFCTQNEPEGFRKITPYLDRPDVMSVFTSTLTADKNKFPILLSNGNKLQCHDFVSSSVENSRHGVTWYDPHPKPSYLFALVAGDLGIVSDNFITKSGVDIELNIYCDKGNEHKCLYAIKSLKQAMAWDEETYSREYDLDIYNIVAVDSFNMGAMENKGLNIFNTHYVLADEETATDANFKGIQSVIAHEYFHNWTGNRITCKNWFQLTLKEGLTVYRDQTFSADLNSRTVQRIEDVKSLRDRQFSEDASSMSHPIQPKSYISMNNFYTATVYEKGAEVIRMIKTLTTNERYKKAMDLYFDTFDGQAIGIEDFLWAMSKGADISLEQFERWYHQSGTPSLKIEENFKEGTYSIDITQIVPNSVDGKTQEPYYFPFKIGLILPNGVEILEEVLIISKLEETFYFKNLKEKPILSANRDFSAPVIVEQNTVDYAFLMKYDTNSFSRYEASQSFATATLEKIIEGKEPDKEFINSYRYLLELDTELSYKARLLEFPSISSIIYKQTNIDFDILYDAKDTLLKAVCESHRDILLHLYYENHESDNIKIDEISVGKRAIKNRVLQILSSSCSQDIVMLAKKQYDNSKTMTDKISALNCLENISAEFSSLALEDFYKQYSDNTLVMNKYFAILASSSREGVLDRVMALENDKTYDKTVPNLVRSLVGVFARNYKYFHAKDAKGYKFVANKIIEIDKINPQMASALSGAFKIYEKLNSVNKKAMKKELECVVSTQNISNNTYEVISKILK